MPNKKFCLTSTKYTLVIALHFYHVYRCKLWVPFFFLDVTELTTMFHLTFSGLLQQLSQEETTKILIQSSDTKKQKIKFNSQCSFIRLMIADIFDVHTCTFEQAESIIYNLSHSITLVFSTHGSLMHQAPRFSR